MAEEDKLRDYLKRVTSDLRKTTRRLREIEAQQREPIAVVGMGCRYPGDVSSPEDLWELVHGGRDAISSMPAGRDWHLDDLYDPDPDRPGTSSVRHGGFLDDVAGFDAAFFGISPREALALDPQQRLLLETAWESVERAGISPASLRGSRTGVFVGCNPTEYGGLLDEAPAGVGGHLLTGTVVSALSGRLAYVLGLEGPALSIDTACSTSLTAVHLAVQALRRGDCTLALAGGVTVFSTPGAFTEMSRQRVLAADGRCKAFSADADGMGMAEGVGVVVLEPLSAARRNKHRVLAVVRGAAVNSDGASNGLTAPNRYAQERVIRHALADAGLTTAEVDAVEAHGTGTALGDPIEAEALLATYGKNRPAGEPLLLGSLKSNIGHTQAAAGVAGLIKTVLSLRHGELPPTLHADRPTPHVDWSEGTVALVTETRSWPETGRPRRAAVSAFGISGTNAHVILEEAPADEPEPGTEGISPTDRATDQDSTVVADAAGHPLPLLLSAATPAGLHSQARQLAHHLRAHPEQPTDDIGFSLVTTRSTLGHRAVLLGADRDTFLTGLDALAGGDRAAGLITGTARPNRTAFLFSGQGSQRPGMGRELHHQFPVFAKTLDTVCEALDTHLDQPLRDIMFADENTPQAQLLTQTLYTQTALFAYQVALHHQYTAWGIQPDHLIGHSIGELTAAHVAGVLTLPHAAQLVTTRAHLMQNLPTHGTMLAIQATEDEITPTLTNHPDTTIAALNTPTSTVISGNTETINQLNTHWKQQGRKTHLLNVSHAFHSPHMDPILQQFHHTAQQLDYHPPTIPIISNLTGTTATTEQLTNPQYWTDHIRQPVRYHNGIHHLTTHNTTTYLEIGPDTTLTAMTDANLPDVADGGDGRDRRDSGESRASGVAIIPSSRRGRPEVPALLQAVGRLHATGAPVGWQSFLAGRDLTAVDLPTYPFQHQSYWLPATRRADSKAGIRPAEHPLLGAVVEVADPDRPRILLTGHLSGHTPGWLADHVIGDAVLLPGTGQVDIALYACELLGCDQVAELTLHEPMVIPPDDGLQIQVSVEEADAEGRRALTLYARPGPDSGEVAADRADEETGWTRHTTGMLASGASSGKSDGTASVALAAAGARAAGAGGTSTGGGDEAWPPPGTTPVSLDDFYDGLWERGMHYGPAFQGLRAAWRDDDHLYATLALPGGVTDDATGYGVHPALLDAALHAFALHAPEETDLRLPFAWSGVRRHGTPTDTLRARITPTGPDTASLIVSDIAGMPVMSVEKLTLRPVSAAILSDRRDAPLFGVAWRTLPQPAGPLPAVTVAGPAGLQEALAAGDQDRTAGPRSVVLHWPAGNTHASGAAVPDGAGDETRHALTLLREWLADPRSADTRLAFVTRGAVATDPAEDVLSLRTAPLWGLLRSAQTEHPGRFVLIDADADAGTDAGAGRDTEAARENATALVRAALATGEPQVAIRGDALRVPRLTRLAADKQAHVPVLDPEGTVLITGAGGALGAHVATHLAERHGARRLLLLSRGGQDSANAHQLRTDLEALGAQVTFAACDVSDRDALAAALALVPAENPLTAVVHAAGVVEDATLTELTEEKLDSVLRPKIDGAWHLHELTADTPPAVFALFSSFAGLVGNPGQANYAAANSFLDALAHHRMANGAPAVSLAWGLWEQGMGGRLDDAGLARIVRAGIRPMSTGHALALMDTALAAPGALGVPVDLDRSAIRAQARAGTLPEFLRELAPAPARTPDGSGSGVLAARLATLSNPEADRAVLDVVRRTAALALNHPDTDSVLAGQSFRDLGFDSLTAVEMRNQLNTVTGLRLSATLVFDHPTPRELAAHLRAELTGALAALPTTPPRRTTRAVSTDDDDPVVVVGMSCRYPGGVTSPEELWELVSGGGDGISTFPDNRGWDIESIFAPDSDRPGTTYTRSGGFLHQADVFDAEFFGISPREAAAMDPQQRLLLELSWEALERAGIRADELRGSSGGVFTGIMYSDYGGRLLMRTPAEYEGYVGNGSAPSVASGRVAYTFGLEGPALTVDTACSSSLVALHLAAQALRQGECDMALAGGATIMATPAVFVEFSRQRGLAPDGRCKSFSTSADGTGWGEGVGILVLERLSDAQAKGHPVLAVLRGSAVNQDGASNGLTAPNGPSQQRVIEQALANARLTGAEVDVVEAHGTGTVLGDPIEAQALLATYGTHHTAEQPLWLGSVKSNIGHTQAAAGVAGVIKMVEAMRHGRLPQTLHVDEPSQHVDWDRGTVALLTETRSWPETGRPRRAAVSAFGISGTNAHVILEQPPSPEPPATAPYADESGGASGGDSGNVSADAAFAATESSTEPPVVLLVSGGTSAGLRSQAGRLATYMDADPAMVEVDLAWSLATRRTALVHRAAVLGGDRSELLSGLKALAEDRSAGNVVWSDDDPVEGGTAFLFSGQGSQRPGMGRELHHQFPVFAKTLDTVCEALDTHLDQPLRDIMFADENTPQAQLLTQTLYTQTALFAYQVALHHQYTAWGIQPDHLIGHSIGELTAAHVAGVLTLPHAAQLVTTRAHLMQNLPTHGTMLAIQATEDEITPTLTNHPDTTIAALNTPTSTVISGNTETINQLNTHWKQQGRKTHLLNVSHAFHSPHMDPILQQFHHTAQQLDYHPPTIPIISNLTGTTATTEQLTNPQYWTDHIRQPVRYHNGIHHLTTHNTTTYLEIGPDTTLTAMTDANLPAGHSAVLVPSQRPQQPQAAALLSSLAALHAHGTSPRWTDVLPPGRALDLPTYAFQHERYWIDPVDTTAAGKAHDDPSGWRYTTRWTLLPQETRSELTGTWLVVVPEGRYNVAEAAGASRTEAGADPAAEPGAEAWIEAATASLRHAGADVVTTTVDTATARERAALARQLDKAADGKTLSGVLSLLALITDRTDNPRTPEATDSAAALTATATLTQALGDTAFDAPLWVATRQTASVGADDPLINPEAALAWGFGRVVALEAPARWGGLIDLPEVPDANTRNTLVRALSSASDEDQVAIRPTGLHARRIHRAPTATPAREQWPPRGTVLITGGTGGLGARVARWLAANGADHLMLLSRRGPDAPGAAELREELTAAGTQVTIVACDAADRAALTAALAATPAKHPLSAVVHTAGVSEDREVDSLDADHLSRVLAPKVMAARHLHELTQDASLSAFVLFSSTAGVWGSGGQSAYAAGNAYLDALAQHRRAHGLPATAVAWGAWSGEGMAADPETEQRLRRRGVIAMAPDDAVAALAEAVRAGEDSVTIADIDWGIFTPAFTSRRPSPFLGELADARVALGTDTGKVDESAPDAAANLRSRLAGLSAEEQERDLLDLVRNEVAAILGHTTTDGVRAGRPFNDLGFDSLTAVELRNRLSTLSGLRLPTTIAFDYPTPADLAEFLRSEVFTDTSGTASILVDIDRIDAAFTDGSLDHGLRRKVTDRLRTLLAQWSEEEGRDAGTDDHDLESASVDDLLDIIQTEFRES